MSLFNDQEKRIKVLLPLPLGESFDYLQPPGMALDVGDFVCVPFGPRTRIGVVWPDIPDDTLKPEKLKPVLEKLDLPALPDASIRLVDWVAKYTLQSKGAVLKMALSSPKAFQAPKPTFVLRLPPHTPDGLKITKARQQVFDVLSSHPDQTAGELAKRASVSPGVIRTMIEQGAIERTACQNEPALPLPDWRKQGFPLSDSQATAADDLVRKTAKATSKTGFSVTLLDGVPGSGKTEVYFEAVAKALENNLQVLVMLPEIALSSQWLGRFERRFGVKPAVWHSDISQGERAKTWRAILKGRAPVVVGARSALFLPYRQLGLIIVDEEHDTSFKQEEGVIYNARDMAVVRAQLGALPIVLASATPSLETMVNAWEGRYDHLKLSARHKGVPLPAIETVDLRHDPPQRQKWLSPHLIAAMRETIERGEQVMLYLNRRGYAPLTLCRACGHRLQCPNCTSWLVAHRHNARLQCHHCGFHRPTPKSCPECDAEDKFAACGPGVERLAEEVADVFPDLICAQATSDTITSAKEAYDLVRRVESGKINILIGTQMIAKGYHFPLLTLVGVVDADLGLAGGDLRASERTYQLLYQVAGRAGRGDKPGSVLLQTYMPDHPVMAAMKGTQRDEFLKAEAEARRQAAMPPFGRLCAVIVSGEDEVLLDDYCAQLGRSAPGGPGLSVLGPAPAPLAMIRGRHRRRFLIKADKGLPLQRIISDWMNRHTGARQMRVQIDMDPYSFL